MVQLPAALTATLLVRAPSTTAARAPERSRLTHEADDHTGTGERWRLATFLLFGSCSSERTGIAHVVPGGRDPAVGTLDVRDAELVDVAVEGIGDAAHACAGFLNRKSWVDDPGSRVTTRTRSGFTAWADHATAC
jgi:hypothetical protein